MLAGEFQQKLRKINPHLRVFASDSETSPAGVYYYQGYGEYDSICGVSKNFVPEFSEFAPNGAIKRGGWRRVLDILLTRKLIDRRKAEKVFGFHWDTRRKPPKQAVELEPWYQQWLAAKDAARRESIRRFGKEEEGYMRWQDVVDIHRMKTKGKAHG